MKTILSVLFFAILGVAVAHAQTCAPLTACLAWQDNADNEDGFNVERNLNGSIFTAILGTIGANVTSVVDATLEQSNERDNIYCYRTRAFNAAGFSNYSNTVCATIPQALPPPEPEPEPVPAAPSNLQLSSITSSAITLSWQDNATNETQQGIYRRTGNRPHWDRIATVGANTTAYLDSGLKNRTKHCYRVTAENSQSSPPSGEACGETLR